MSAPTDNPFDRYDIDPREGPEGITERMRELVEDAPNEAARDAMRQAWEALTRDPRRTIAPVCTPNEAPDTLASSRPQRIARIGPSKYALVAPSAPWPRNRLSCRVHSSSGTGSDTDSTVLKKRSSSTTAVR